MTRLVLFSSLAVVLVLPRAHKEVFCSKVTFIATRQVGNPYFIGSAIRDTVLAGAGSVSYLTGSSEFGLVLLINGYVFHIDYLSPKFGP